MQTLNTLMKEDCLILNDPISTLTFPTFVAAAWTRVRPSGLPSMRSQGMIQGTGPLTANQPTEG